MKAMKIILLVIGGFVVVGAGVFALVFQLTAGAADSADALFARIASGDVRGAYESTAPIVQRQQSFEDFAGAVEALGLDQWVSSSWNSRSISGGQATISGTVTLADGSSVPLQVDLVESGDEWLVYAVGGPQAGATPVAYDMPSTEDARALAQGSMTSLANAIAQEDFSGFYNHISALWREQTTADAIQQGFQVYIDQDVDLRPVVSNDPELSNPPLRDAQGAMILSGFFPNDDAPVYFRLRYVFQNHEWRLIGVRIGESPPEPFDGE